MRWTRSRVTTACAAAGYGKTTAMLYWSRELAKRGRVVLWLALRAGIDMREELAEALGAAAVKAGPDWPQAGAGIPVNQRLRNSPRASGTGWC